MGRQGKLAAMAALGVAFVTLGQGAPAQGAIYFNTQGFAVADGTQGTGTATCDDNSDEVIGAGIYSNPGLQDFIYLNGLTPYTSNPDGARVYADNYAGGEPNETPLAVVACDSAARPADYRHVDELLEVPDATERGTTAKCRSGESVVGGGSSNSGGFSDEAIVSSTGPVDLGDPDKVPDDGWRGEVNNDEDGGAATLGATTYAICDSKHGDVRYRSLSRNVHDGQIVSKDVHCKGRERVIGGGVVSHSAYRHGLYVTDSFNIAGDDGWVAHVDNWPTPDGKTRRFTVTAICLG